MDSPAQPPASRPDRSHVSMPRQTPNATRLSLVAGAGLALAAIVLVTGGILGVARAVGPAPDAVGGPSPAASARPSAVARPTSEPTAALTNAPTLDPTLRPTAALDPPPPPSPTPPPGPFEIDLYRPDAFASQIDKITCVPAAMQTMANIISRRIDHEAASQRRYYDLARALSPGPLTGIGAEPEGWAAGLTELGQGSYEARILPTLEAAIHEAARALRMTGRPVGLVTWRGAHSWVMSGFRATTDPIWTDAFTVTDVYVEDVWYPRISTIWGASRPPDSLVPVTLLPEDYLPFKRPREANPDKDGQFVLILPAPDPDVHGVVRGPEANVS
jgi:hypothetical protein